MFRTVPLSIIMSFSLYTQQWYMCWQLAGKLSANLFDIYLLLCVQWKTPDDGQKTCPKHVEFYSENTFEKLLHLVVFIIRNFSRLSFHEVMTGFSLWFSPEPDDSNTHGVSEVSGPVLGPTQPFFFSAYWEQCGRGVKLATELHLVPQLRTIEVVRHYSLYSDSQTWPTTPSSPMWTLPLGFPNWTFHMRSACHINLIFLDSFPLFSE